MAEKRARGPPSWYALLKASWAAQAKLFFESSTLHGIRYVADTGRPPAERIMWFVCVSIGAVTAAIIITSLWEKFQTNPTITGLDTDFHNWDVAFPAVTVCGDFPINRRAVASYARRRGVPVEQLTNFIANLAAMSYGTLELLNDDFYQERIVPAGVDLKDFIFQFMGLCEEIFSNCIWKSESYACCDGFLPIFTEIGFCFAFNSRHYERTSPSGSKFPKFEQKYIKETDIKWSLKFQITATENVTGIPIFIHNSDETPGLDIKAQHIWIGNVDKISFSAKQTYTTTDTRQLSTKQRHCVFEDEISLQTDHIYTYSACTKECRMKVSKKVCGCVPYFYKNTAEYRHCSLDELKCIKAHLQDIVSADCSCMLGCSNTVYHVEKFRENPSNSLETEFVSWPMVRYKREVLFGWIDLLVSFGGIAGLFLGFSLLSAVEIIYYFTIRAFCMVKMETEQLKKLRRDEVLKHKKIVYDMNLKPKFLRKTRSQQLFKRNINFSTNCKISPFKPSKGNLNTSIVSPFGIEYLN